MSSLLSMCIPTPQKHKKDKRSHCSRRGPGGGVAPILDHFVSTNISQQQLDKEAKLGEKQESSPPAHKHHHHHHPNCENDSQKSATSSCNSGDSHSTHTSGYQTDDGTFEGKMLHLATKSRPANIRMTAIKDYNPCCDEELVLRRGQRVKVLYKNNEWVYAMTKTGQTGYVPYSYVRPSRKYAGYQSEPEYMADTDVYQSGYETDMPVSSASRRYGGTRTQIADASSPPCNVRTGFRGSPENQQCGYQGQRHHHGYPSHQQQYNQQQQQQQQQRHHSRLGSGGSSGGGYSPPASAVSRNPPAQFASGYTSAVEYPISGDARRRHHPRSKPTEEKPEVNSFQRELLEELVVIHDFEANEEDEAFVSKGERVKVLNADDPFWLWVETTPGVQGFIPRSCCSLGNHPSLQSSSTRQQLGRTGQVSTGRNARRYYYQRSRAQTAARQARTHAKQRFHELARQRNNSQNPVLMDKDEIKRVGSKLIVLMDYTATQEDELSIQFAETVFADVLKQAGAERIWAYCPRSEQCGFVPVALVVPPVV